MTTTLDSNTLYTRQQLQEFAAANESTAPLLAWLRQAYGEVAHPSTGEKAPTFLVPKHEGFLPHLDIKDPSGVMRVKMTVEDLLDYVVDVAYVHGLAEGYEAPTDGEEPVDDPEAATEPEPTPEPTPEPEPAEEAQEQPQTPEQPAPADTDPQEEVAVGGIGDVLSALDGLNQSLEKRTDSLFRKVDKRLKVITDTTSDTNSRVTRIEQKLDGLTRLVGFTASAQLQLSDDEVQALLGLEEEAPEGN
jgi:hypothetical protein